MIFGKIGKAAPVHRFTRTISERTDKALSDHTSVVPRGRLRTPAQLAGWWEMVKENGVGVGLVFGILVASFNQFERN
jgi:hypothetical protein